MRYSGVGLAAVLVVGAAWFAQADDKGKPDAKGDRAALIKQGEYLVNEVAHCGHCHTPTDAKGNPDLSRRLQGAPLRIVPKEKTKNWASKAPDLTPSGVAGTWSEAELIKFLTTGRNLDEEKPTPPMPAFRLKERDARAVTLYLKSLPGKKGERGKGKGGRASE
jgi:mono/diheme cytochrome c family protein